MQLRIYDPRILALDLRARRFGYAVFEGPRRLLDSGTRANVAGRPEESGTSARALSEFLKLWSPATIVIKKQRWELASEWAIREALLNQAKARSIDIRLLDQTQLNYRFRQLGCSTKEDVAEVLAKIFPELIWTLPPKRKVWESEHPRMSVFDAIALGLVYWQSETKLVMDLSEKAFDQDEEQS